MGCFSWILVLAGGVLLMVSLLRWFEQITDAVDGGHWNRVSVLLAFPLAVWFYESKIAAGRPVPVPHHEPVRGFGKVSLEPPKATVDEPPLAQRVDAPPGTPKEFMGLPKIPPKKAIKSSIDPDKMERLRQKMREQGMLPPE